MVQPWNLRSATPADASAIASVHLRSWQTAYRGIFPDAFLDGMMDALATRTERWRTGLEHPIPADSRTYLLEIPGGGVAGFVACGSAREAHAGYPGELYTIYLLAEHRGQGLGRVLFTACRAYLASLGYQCFYLWVVDRNPTCGFYRALGGTVIPELTKQATIGGTAVTEIAFGWNDQDVPGPARP